MKRIGALGAILLLCLCGRVNASGNAIRLIEPRPFRTLQGVVKAAEEQPLTGAVLLEVFARASVQDNTASAVPVTMQYANADGSFSFPNLPEGAYELRVSVPGGNWNVTQLYLKIQPHNQRAKTRPIELPLTLKD